jgi:hypothetical protein
LSPLIIQNAESVITASIYLHVFLIIIATYKPIYALLSILNAEDTQNGTHIPGSWTGMTSLLTAVDKML